MSLRAHGGSVYPLFSGTSRVPKSKKKILIKSPQCFFGSPRNLSLILVADIVETRAHLNVFFSCSHLASGPFRALRMLHSPGPLLGTDRSLNWSPISSLPSSSISNEQAWIRNKATHSGGKQSSGGHVGCLIKGCAESSLIGRVDLAYFD